MENKYSSNIADKEELIEKCLGVVVAGIVDSKTINSVSGPKNKNKFKSVKELWVYLEGSESTYQKLTYETAKQFLKDNLVNDVWLKVEYNGISYAIMLYKNNFFNVVFKVSKWNDSLPDADQLRTKELRINFIASLVIGLLFITFCYFYFIDIR